MSETEIDNISRIISSTMKDDFPKKTIYMICCHGYSNKELPKARNNCVPKIRTYGY